MASIVSLIKLPLKLSGTAQRIPSIQKAMSNQYQ